MPFKAGPVQPQFADLIVSLTNSQLQTKDNALYQTIKLLIERITRMRDLLVDDLDDLEKLLNGFKNVTFLTQDNEVILLPNSRQLLSSLGIQFDDSVFAERTLRLTHYWTPLTDGSEPEAEIITAVGDAIAVQVPVP